MIFLDTSFLVSYYNKKDDNHNHSLKIMNEIANGIYGDVYISDYIFDECATVLFARLNNLKKAVTICEKIKQLIIFKIDQESFEESWRLFKNQKDTKLSFTDCSNIAIMKSEGTKNIVTFDEDFKKVEGLNVVN